MTLQAFRLPNSTQEVTGPPALWCTSLAAFGVCLLVSAWSYWLDARLLFYMAEELTLAGKTGEHPQIEKILTAINICMRVTFPVAVVAAAAYFIVQRLAI